MHLMLEGRASCRIPVFEKHAFSSVSKPSLNLTYYNACSFSKALSLISTVVRGKAYVFTAFPFQTVVISLFI